MTVYHRYGKLLDMKKSLLQIDIPVSIMREGSVFIAYTPVLDLSTSGKSYDEVKRRFNEIVEIFFEELAIKGTLEEALSDLGWEKISRKWSPPVVISQELHPFRLSLAA